MNLNDAQKLASEFGLGSGQCYNQAGPVDIAIGKSAVMDEYTNALYSWFEIRAPEYVERRLSESDLHEYLTALLYMRISQFDKAAPRLDVSPALRKKLAIPSYFYVLLAQIGFTTVERYKVQLMPRIAPELTTDLCNKDSRYVDEWLLRISGILQYLMDFTDARAYGIGLPMETEGDPDFMLFSWSRNVLMEGTKHVEQNLQHMHAGVEAGIQGLAAFLDMKRDFNVLNPTVTYDREGSYKSFAQHVGKRG